ncbi:MAG TPA: sugar ABC transporter permease [Acidimicrobiia bacterium]|nr:sugar ABC transporter permease [Acidimicrobiia bacterium]
MAVETPPPARGKPSMLVEAAPRAETVLVQRRVRVKGEGGLGWLFSAPAFIGLLVFVAIPIVLTAWVSLRDWSGLVSPFNTEYIGFENYRELLFEDGVRRTDFALSIRNNFYYVLFVVPMQTILAFVLAVILNNKFLKGKGFFRTAYYFPSITSSIAVTLIFVFLFQTQGAINAILPFPTINWLNNANGLFHIVLGAFGVDQAPAFLAENEFMGVTFWQWIAGPSVAMFAIILLVTWTTTGTFMLIFLAGLQSIPESVEEAAKVDGASTLQTFWHITIPLMRPTIYFVVTIGLIATWQVFDQIYATNFGGPQKTTMTPAFLIYFQSFRNSEAALAGAIAILLLLVIMLFTFIQRRAIKSSGPG